MWKKFLIVAATLYSGMAMADTAGGGRPGHHDYGCSQWNGQPQACAQGYGCRYDFQWNVCLDDNNPYPNPGPNPYPNPYPNPGPKPYPNPYPNPGPNPYPNPGPNPYPNPGPNPYPNPYPNPGPNPYPNPYPNPGPNPYPNPYPNPGPNPYPNPGPRPMIGWCAGGPAAPAFALGSQQEAVQCARQIARGGNVCNQAARFGQCDLTRAYPGWQANPNQPRCMCSSVGPTGPVYVTWYGTPYHP